MKEYNFKFKLEGVGRIYAESDEAAQAMLDDPSVTIGGNVAYVDSAQFADTPAEEWETAQVVEEEFELVSLGGVLIDD
jgi:hypothetical protein